MLFDSKKRQEKREAKQRERLVKVAMARDPLFLSRLENERRIVQDSIELMSATVNLKTFVGRYSTLRDAAIRLNGLLRRIGDEVPDLEKDADILFLERVHEVVDVELAQAAELKTDSGRRKRWDAIVNTLERCDREEGSRVEEVIQDEQFRVFRLLEEGVDWSKEPEQAELVLSEKALREGMARAALAIAKERELPEDEAWEIIKKTLLK